MTDHRRGSPPNERDNLRQETGRIRFGELQRHFASGRLRKVHMELDLVDVACRVAADDTVPLRQWLQRGWLEAVSDAQARVWHAENAMLLAVVVKPWVLVQELPGSPAGIEP